MDVIPGISDHDIPTVDIDITPIRREQAQCKIPIYRKANWDKIKDEINKVADKIKQDRYNKSANKLWVMFKDTIQHTIEQHIPTKLCKIRQHTIYDSRNIKTH